MTVDQATPTGLTARRKERVRQQLADAAVVLFCERGYDRTTIDDIAAAVEVSPRTVYRYFATKEDLVIAPGEANFAAFLDALSARPKDEPLGEAVQAAVREALEPTWKHPDRMRAFMAMIRGTPVLRARYVEQAYDAQRQLGAVIATRAGVDPAEIRPLIVAGAITMSINSAIARWTDLNGEGSPAALVSEALSLLETPLLSQPPAAGQVR